jgi:hypothetical protein
MQTPLRRSACIKEQRTALGLLEQDAVDGVKADVDDVVELQWVARALLEGVHEQRVVLRHHSTRRDGAAMLRNSGLLCSIRARIEVAMSAILEEQLTAACLLSGALQRSGRAIPTACARGLSDSQTACAVQSAWMLAEQNREDGPEQLKRHGQNQRTPLTMSTAIQHMLLPILLLERCQG